MWCTQMENIFQSTPSAWRETKRYFVALFALCISIHSLRMEGDPFFHLYPPSSQEYFNPLPPHGGRPVVSSPNTPYIFSFQSTPSAWRETWNFFYLIHNIVISIHSLRMEGDFMRRSFEKGYDISIHSLRMEGDKSANCSLPRSPISIHSLRMEGDVLGMGGHCIHWTFQSTPSAWRETCFPRSFRCRIWISIHSLRMEGDLDQGHAVGIVFISIHSLRMEGDELPTNGT